MKTMKNALFVAAMLAVTACHHHDEHGHAHEGDGHKAEAEAPEAEPLAITRWTDRYELFVELPPPVAGTPVAYHAHVTRLVDFQAVTEGRFTTRFKSGDAVVKEHTVTGVKRPGIFVFEGESPPVGKYTVEMEYAIEGTTDVWDCGEIEVLAAAPPPGVEAADTSITFLKESQWKIAFGTAWAEERPIAERLDVAAVIEPAGSDQLTIGAPTTGRFLHDPRRSLTEGLRIEKGDVIGSIVPTVAGEDYSRLVFAVDEARLALEQNGREIKRVEPLVEQGLLPPKRLTDLRNEAEVQGSRLKLARERAGVLGGGARGGVPIKAELGGVVSEVLIPNGETVSAGAPLVRLGGTHRLWARARFFPRGRLDAAQPVGLRLSDGQAIDLMPAGAKFVASAPSIDPASRVATWMVDLGTPKEAFPPQLRPGAGAVLTIRFGEPKLMLAVPRGAVVEINTRPYTFVQIDGEHFEKRLVVPGPADGDFIPIVEGVKKGERVVTTGGFDIHLAAVMGTVESHRH